MARTMNAMQAKNALASSRAHQAKGHRSGRGKPLTAAHKAKIAESLRKYHARCHAAGVRPKKKK